MQKQAYPYCKHGAYVGGCGADYMCGPCEMGDPDPTPRELLDRVIWEADKVAKTRARMTEAFSKLAPKERAEMEDFFDRPDQQDYLLREFRSALNYFESIFLISTDLDDRDWLNRLHAKHEAEWNKQTAEDQFWSLPDEILVGP